MKKLYKKESKINGRGLFTATAFQKGDFIAYIDGPIVVIRKFTPTTSKKTLNWIGVSKYSWINTDQSKFRYINHSCDPNTAQVTKRKLVAIKNISVGEELTFDYSLTEGDEDWIIENCFCGAKNCRGKIESLMKLSKKVFKEKEAYIPKNFKTTYCLKNNK